MACYDTPPVLRICLSVSRLISAIPSPRKTSASFDRLHVEKATRIQGKAPSDLTDPITRAGSVFTAVHDLAFVSDHLGAFHHVIGEDVGHRHDIGQ